MPDSQKNVGENHAVSGLKFRILRRFLDLGYAVLLSDVDIVTLQNPFHFLVRDCDVESMSDGWDNATAYGAACWHQWWCISGPCQQAKGLSAAPAPAAGAACPARAQAQAAGVHRGLAAGYNDVKDDPAMGWARYAHSMRVFVFNSGLFYIRPTEASIALLDAVAHRLATENGWDQALFNEVTRCLCLALPSSAPRAAQQLPGMPPFAATWMVSGLRR